MRFHLSMLLALFATAASAQIPSRSYTTSTPVPGAGHDYINAPVETVNPASGSLSIRIGVPMPPARGVTVPFSFTYDSNGVFYLASLYSGGTTVSWATTRALLSQGGWSYTAPTLSVQKTPYVVQNNSGSNVTCSALTDYVFQDATGNRHNLALSYFGGRDPACFFAGDVYLATTGGEGPMLATTTSNWSNGSVNPVTVTDGDGTVYSFGFLFPQPTTGICQPTCTPTTYLPLGITDRNGNGLSITSNKTSGPILQYTDSTGRTALNIPTFGANPDTVTASGLIPYQVTWTTVTANYHVSLGNFSGARPCSIAGTQPSIKAVQSITLPNGKQFTFSYDPVYGMVNKITYPTGGYVRYVWGLNSQSAEGTWPATTSQDPVGHCYYTYDTPAILHRYESFDGVNEVLQQDFSYSTNWPALGSAWKTTVVTTHDLIRGSAYSNSYTYAVSYGDIVPNVSDRAPNVPVESKIQYYADTNTAGNPLRTVNKKWFNERVLTQQQTTLENGLISETDWTYDPLGNEQVVEQDDYDYGSGAHGGLLRATATSYAAFSPHIVDRPSSVSVYNVIPGSTPPPPLARITYSYDQDGACCGNLTTKTEWVNQSGSSTLPTTYVHDGYGHVTGMSDPAGNHTAYDYSDDYVDNCSFPAATNAYLTNITHPSTSGVSHVGHFRYYCATGNLASSRDQNNQTSSYQYNDPLLRLTAANYPDGGQMTYSYNDSPGSLSIQQTTKQDSSTSLSHYTYLDGLGRSTRERQVDSEGDVFSDTTYDPLGRVYTVSNPYRTTGDPTYGLTTTQYDVLSRPVTVIRPDGNTIQSVYSGNTTTTTDETGRKRQTTADALGRLTSVVEPNPATGSLGAYTTTYSYDALGNLLSVNQPGDGSQPARNRSFTYDSLSRLLTSINPESGTINYHYANQNNSALPCAGNPSILCWKTDARGVNTYYQYDALDRITNVSYSDSTTPRWWFYDQTSFSGIALANSIGRLSLTSTQAVGPDISAHWYSYDQMGRIALKGTCFPTDCSMVGTSSATYDLAGHLATLNYPAGRSLTYTYSSAGRLSSITEPAIGKTYLNVSSTWPTGAWHTASLGNGTQTSDLYNNRLQTTERMLFAPNGNTKLADRQYSWSGCPLGGNNGNVCAITDVLNSGHSQSFAYDYLNRITSGVQADNSFNQTFSIDPWGNLKQSGTWSFLPTYNSNNQIASFGVTYDAAGNTTKDALGNTYTYDAEEQLRTSSSGGSYVYDTEGERVRKTVGANWTDYATFGGNTIAEFNSDGTWTDYVFAHSKRITQFDHGSTIPTYHWTDHLGSISVVTDNTGAIKWQGTFAPFGQPASSSGTLSTHYQFTGKERDTESGLDYFGARYYASTMGRWMSPDWAAKEEPVPYAILEYPQSLNLYGYVRNRPLSSVDANGHDGANACCDLGPMIDEIDAIAKPLIESAVAGAEVAGEVALRDSLGVLGILLSAQEMGNDPAEQKMIRDNRARAEHTKDTRPSTQEKHEKGLARKRKDRGGEKGDERRRPPRKRPDGWKGPWPPPPPPPPPPTPPAPPPPSPDPEPKKDK